MMGIISFAIVILLSFSVGAISLLGYMVWRMSGDDESGKPSPAEAERIILHVVSQPEDFGNMYYLSDYQRQLIGAADNPDARVVQRPFWYMDKTKFSEVVKARPVM